MGNQNNQNNNGDKKPISAAEAIGFLAFAGVAVVATHEKQIRLWFYDNMIMLILGAFGLVALLVMYAVHRMKKKDREFIERAKSLNQVKPMNRRPNDYYKRRY